MSSKIKSNKNPLLQNLELPPFEEIKVEFIEEAIFQRLTEVEADLTKIESHIVPSWDKLIQPLYEMEEKLHRTWSPISHLTSVANSDPLRVVYEKVHKKVVDFYLRYQQSQAIYDGLAQIKNGAEWNKLDASQKRSLELRIQSAQLSGLALKDDEREEFNRLNKELSQLEFEFSNAVLDSSKEFFLEIKNKEDVQGFPEHLLQLSSQMFNKRFPDKESSNPEEGPWLITLDIPVFLPFMENCQKSELRKKVYMAYISRASTGQHDNNPRILKILSLRKKIANLLQFKNYAELSLVRKMVPSVAEVFRFEEELRAVSYKKSKEEFEELRSFAKSKGETKDLRQWDIAYWVKRMQEERFQFKEEELKPYFSFDQVLSGMFSLANKLFAIKVEQHKGVQVWNPDVRFFKVFNDKNELVASFYLDPFARIENKRGGAWMNECVGRFYFEGKLTKPIAYLVCNFTPPIKDQPSLLTFEEVKTLFHEFGHALQHMLTQINYRDVSGINGIEWDAVELPSQFMENWCYDKSTLKKLGKHYQSGETIPEFFIEKIMQTRTFRAASQILRQIQFALLDMKAHAEFDPEGKKTIAELQKDVVSKTSILPFLEEDKTLCAFSHIFAGGYAAGYYSYKWAELMSSDAFAKFEEEGLEKEDKVQTLGRRFRDTILSLGGGQPALEVYKSFRGRAPDTQAFLRHAGLLDLV